MNYDSSTTALSSIFLKSDIVKVNGNQNNYEVEFKFCQRTVSRKVNYSSVKISTSDGNQYVDLANLFSEDSAQAYPSACLGHEYVIENFVKVVGTMKDTDIAFSADIMTPKLG